MDSDVDESHAEATPLDNGWDATVQPQIFHTDTWNDVQSDLLLLDWRIFRNGDKVALKKSKTNYWMVTGVDTFYVYVQKSCI